MPSLELAEQVIDTRRGERVVLVAMPQVPFELGQRRLAELREQTSLSDLDRILLEQVKAWGRPAQALVWAADAGGGRWSFDDKLDPQEVADMGYHLVRTHRDLYSGLVLAGISLVYFAGFGEAEREACEMGTRRLIAELERDRDLYHGEEAVRREADLWLLRDLVTFRSNAYTDLLAAELPDRLPLCESRADQVREKLAALAD